MYANCIIMADMRFELFYNLTFLQNGVNGQKLLNDTLIMKTADHGEVS